MADVVIQGMEMPKDGVYWCEIGIAGEIATITIHGEDRKSFPLLSLQEGHGKCIDADALIQKLLTRKDGSRRNDRDSDGWPNLLTVETVRTAIENAPTIIPAEGGTDDDN